MYATRGFKIFPLHHINDDGKCSCGKSDCIPKNAGKHPRVKEWQNAATDNTEIVKAWWKKWPLANIGLACKESGLIVIDVDLHDEDKNGFQALEDFELTFNERLDTPFMAETGGNGAHFFFKSPEALESTPANFGENYPGIDIKYRGYVLLSPSNHRSGNIYKWVEGCDKDFYPQNLPPLPKSVCDLIAEATKDIKYSPMRNTFAFRDVDSEELEQIREALSYISPDGVGYNDMLKIGMSLQYYLGDSNGWSLFVEWMSKHSKFNMKKCLKHWRSFRRTSGGVRTIASLFELASEFGFENEGFNRDMILKAVDPDDYFYMTPQPLKEEVRTIAENPIVHDHLPGVIFEGIYIDSNAVGFPYGWTPELWLDPNAIADYGQPEMYIDPYAIALIEEVPEVINNYVNTVPQSFYKSSNSELFDKLNKLEATVLKDSYGMLPQNLREMWHKKLGNNRVLCDLFDWQMRVTAVGCPQMALSFALVAMGGLLSGRFSAGGVTTNLYFTVVAPTSVGKTQTMNALKNLYIYCKDEMRIGGDIRSDGGFRNEMLEEKNRTFMIDEVGLFFKKIMNPRANDSQQAIGRSLLDGFTGFGDSRNVEAKRADLTKSTAESNTLSNYAPQFFGVTTGATFWENLTGADSVSGMLNRLIIMQADESDLLPKKLVASGENKLIPVSFMEWYQRARARIGKSDRVGIAGVANQSVGCQDLDLSPEAHRVLIASLQVEDDLIRSDKKFGQIYARLTEITKRVALIVEICDDPEAKSISGGSVMLAFDLVKACLDASYKSAHENIVENEVENLERKTFNVIYGYANNGVSLTELYKIDPLKSELNKRSMIIKGMKDAGLIKMFVQKTGKRGAPPKLVMASEFYNPNLPLPDGWVEV